MQNILRLCQLAVALAFLVHHAGGAEVKSKVAEKPLPDDTIRRILKKGTLKLYFENERTTPIMAALQKEPSVDASQLKVEPDITIEGEVNLSNGSPSPDRPNERSVIFEMNNASVKKLQKMSNDRIGERLLIVFGSKAIAAPRISAPLAWPRINFPVRDPHAFDVAPKK